jgi:hypothetical protein
MCIEETAVWYSYTDSMLAGCFYKPEWLVAYLTGKGIFFYFSHICTSQVIHPASCPVSIMDYLHEGKSVL